MGYDPRRLGPGLKALRETRGLMQADVAKALGRSLPAVSRLEQPNANPQFLKLLRYLEAIDCDLEDLHAEIQGWAVDSNPLDDALDEAVRTANQKLRDDPAYRRIARDLIERFGGPEPSSGLRVIADLIDDQDQRLRELERDKAVRNGKRREERNASPGS